MATRTASTIPVSLLREAVGHVVEVELASHDEYRGTLAHVDPNMNARLTKVTHTGANSRQSKLDEVFLRGSAVRLFVLPRVLANAPVLRHAQQMKDAQQQQQQQQQQQRGTRTTREGAAPADGAARKRQKTA